MRRPVAALACLLAALAATACGRADRTRTAAGSDSTPGLGVKGSTPEASHDLGFPAFAPKNTTRIGGADPVANAAGVARAVFPATTPENRPAAVALIDARDWRAGIAGSVLASTPVRAAILLSNGPILPDASRNALAALRPLGSKAAGGAQVVRVGDVARPPGLRTTDIAGRDPFALARALDAFQTAARGKSSDRVVVVSADDPAFAMPAAAWAAKAGDPVLFVHRNSLPQETKAALLAHDQPRIYILGPPATVSAAVASDLKKLGTVKRLGAANPIDNAIAFARYSDPTFGWGVVDPGHGLVFARTNQPLDAAAASPLSVSGSYGPLLLVASRTGLDGAVGQFLLDIQPGYTRDPVRGVYNHGWIVGDDRAISVATQARIDSLLEIKKAQTSQAQSSSP
ncbi:MAG TPA: cell wall-binding repeat-containing protein [Solirubrobacteraceae bacterium]|nr:cell wall-binding repeat-containing protein [Solirubrobacteraceae bacterium]